MALRPPPPRARRRTVTRDIGQREGVADEPFVRGQTRAHDRERTTRARLRGRQIRRDSESDLIARDADAVVQLGGVEEEPLQDLGA